MAKLKDSLRYPKGKYSKPKPLEEAETETEELEDTEEEPSIKKKVTRKVLSHLK